MMRRPPRSTLFPLHDALPIFLGREEALGRDHVEEHGEDQGADGHPQRHALAVDRKSTRLNSSHVSISYAVFCLKKKKYESSSSNRRSLRSRISMKPDCISLCN